ncbi:apolipoprotein N-acyltransferase [Ornithinimicrobium flavum]|uniref:apolipoprotein N-acyltransferase n=1 Tax=Ornithinimicrobium flavum TaxID=1288636 RepID=UPI001EE803F9|nr:apolipoprotein N-acyltransferase [Ornithinimicrobium flavum]
MLPLRLLLAALGGVALLLAFPGYDQWWLAVVGPLALALATAGARPGTGVLAGFLLGLTWFTPMFTWAGTYAGPWPWLAMSVASALYPAALGGLLALLQRGGAVRPVVGAGAWVLMEYARSVTPFGGFPWGRLAFSQGDSPMLGAVAWVSVLGLGFLVALVGGVLARALQLGMRRGTRSRGRAGRAVGLVALAGALVLAPLLLPRPTGGDTVRVAAVQGELPDDFTRTLTAERGALLERYLDQTGALAEEVDAGLTSRPDLVLWPEGASDLDPVSAASGEETVGRIQEVVDALEAPLLLGATSRTEQGAPRNMVYGIAPGEGLVSEYQKVYLAPFGEFMPLRPLMRHLSPWVDRIPDWDAGEEAGVVPVTLADGRQLDVGVAICFENVMDQAVRDLALGGAQLVVVPTSNAWFGDGHQSVEHLGISRVRAVELGRSVVHISNVGVSGLITPPDGTVHERTELFTQALLEGELPVRGRSPPRCGSGPGCRRWRWSWCWPGWEPRGAGAGPPGPPDRLVR